MVKARAIVQLDLETGEVLKRYPSLISAEKDGFSNSRISLVCQGKRNTHKGFGWAYKDELAYQISDEEPLTEQFDDFDDVILDDIYLLPPAPLNKVTIYSAGASSSTSGGLCSVVIDDDGSETVITKCKTKATNNQMVILAVAKALESLTTQSNITVYSDSKYLIDVMIKHMEQWKLQSAQNRVNWSYWARLLRAAEGHTIEWGHYSKRYNYLPPAMRKAVGIAKAFARNLRVSGEQGRKKKKNQKRNEKAKLFQMKHENKTKLRAKSSN